MSVEVVTLVIAGAWEPYLGPELARERARDAATVLLHASDLSPEHVSDTLTRCFLRATREPYNVRSISGSMVVDAVNEAIAALAEAGKSNRSS